MPSKSAKKNETTTQMTKEQTTTLSTSKKETKPSKKETTKQTAKTEEVVEPVVAVQKETENQVLENTTDTLDASVSDNFSEFISKFQTMLTQFNSLKTELKTLEKMTVKQLKVAQKINNKKKRKGQRAPSGFVKPAPISDELAKFLGKPTGTEMARTDVTKEINKYIRANNLQDKENGRKINPDQSLCKLLKIDNEVILTYFNLQRYMGPHFPKQLKVEVEASTSS